MVGETVVDAAIPMLSSESSLTVIRTSSGTSPLEGMRIPPPPHTTIVMLLADETRKLLLILLILLHCLVDVPDQIL